MEQQRLKMPLVSTTSEPHDPPWIPLTLEEFIGKLKEEEDYWLREEHNTLIQITRLRKIFYDKGGWDEQVIRQATNIEGRYEVILVDGDGDEDDVKENKNRNKNDGNESINKPKRYYGKHYTKEMYRVLRGRQLRTINTTDVPYANALYRPQYRKVVYRKTDRVYPKRAGELADIYKDDHQEVRIPAGGQYDYDYVSDIGHILTGCDAWNYPDTVGLLPGRLNIMRIGPHVTSNVDMSTWLGDIASASAAFLFTYFEKKDKLTLEDMQIVINEFVPGTDMMGNIDAYVIASHYDISLRQGMRFTEILTDYYVGTQYNPPLRNSRYRLFCEAIGLKDWDGSNFSNEAAWLTYYEKELLAATCFLYKSLTDNAWANFFTCIRMYYFKAYKNVLNINLLLNTLLWELKQALQKEIPALVIPDIKQQKQ